jgi:signal transduction histidine kinase
MGGVESRPRVVIIQTALDEGDIVRLAVTDAGKGFDPADAERLFEAFYTTKDTGMGIGLSLSRSIIERHGGRLWAELNPGAGACFFVALLAAAPGAP